MRSLFLAFLLLTAACEDEIIRCGDAEVPIYQDASDFDATRPPTSCSVPLGGPCASMPLTSAPSCPTTPPEEDGPCTLGLDEVCYFCAGAESAWASQSARDAAYCVDGAWRRTVVACGATQ